ncbi:hypothetical protein ACX80N_10570 [Arthrobacter sp. MDT2-16]
MSTQGAAAMRGAVRRTEDGARGPGPARLLVAWTGSTASCVPCAMNTAGCR